VKSIELACGGDSAGFLDLMIVKPQEKEVKVLDLRCREQDELGEVISDILLSIFTHTRKDCYSQLNTLAKKLPLSRPMD